MDQNGRDRFEIPKDMRSMAEASFEQARKAFETFVSNTQQAASSIFHYIECWYNRKRRHSSLGYLSPQAYEASLN